MEKLTEEQKQMVVDNIKLVYLVVNNFLRGRKRGKFTQAELIQLGITGHMLRTEERFGWGLMGAVKSWQGEEVHGCAWSTFAARHIKNAIRLGVKNSNLINNPIAHRYPHPPIVFESEIKEGQLEYFYKQEGWVEEVENHIELEQIKQIVSELPTPWRRVIEEIYYKGTGGNGKVAPKIPNNKGGIGVSKEYVRQTHKKALDLIRQKLNKKFLLVRLEKLGYNTRELF